MAARTGHFTDKFTFADISIIEHDAYWFSLWIKRDRTTACKHDYQTANEEIPLVYYSELNLSCSAKYPCSIKHGAINTYPLHRWTIIRLDLNHTASATADGASHKFFQGYLAGKGIFPGQLGDGFQHGMGATGKDLDFLTLFFREGIQP